MVLLITKKKEKKISKKEKSKSNGQVEFVIIHTIDGKSD